VTFTATLLSVALAGCGGRLGSGTTKPDSTGTSSAAAQQEGSGSADTNGGPVAVDQQTAAQIEGTVNDAQSELDGLDQDFAGDDAVAN
jgi:hypothetical protein